MVVGDAEHCMNCGKKIENASRAWVRVNFKRLTIPKDSRITFDCFDIDFCSLDCLTSYDWKKLKTREAWFFAHSNFEPPH